LRDDILKFGMDFREKSLKDSRKTRVCQPAAEIEGDSSLSASKESSLNFWQIVDQWLLNFLGRN
jgi:hypothetical protein